MAFAELHDRRHVDLVEGREHRRLGLRLHEAFRDLATERRHALARGATIARRNDDGGGRCGDGRRRSGRSHGADRSLAGKRGEHVALGDTAGLAGALDACGVEAGFFGEATHGGRDFGGGSGLGGDRSGFRSRSGGRSRGCGRLGGGSRSGARCVASRARFDRSDDLADHDVGACVDDDGDLAVDFGGAFGGHLVGFVGEERLTLADGVTGLDQPGGQEAPGDGFAHGRDFDFNGHESWVTCKLEPIPSPFNGEIAL